MKTPQTPHDVAAATKNMIHFAAFLTAMFNSEKPDWRLAAKAVELEYGTEEGRRLYDKATGTGKGAGAMSLLNGEPDKPTLLFIQATCLAADDRVDRAAKESAGNIAAAINADPPEPKPEENRSPRCRDARAPIAARMHDLEAEIREWAARFVDQAGGKKSPMPNSQIMIGHLNEMTSAINTRLLEREYLRGQLEGSHQAEFDTVADIAQGKTVVRTSKNFTEGS